MNCKRCPSGTYTNELLGKKTPDVQEQASLSHAFLRQKQSLRTASANFTVCGLGMITVETGSDSASLCLCADGQPPAGTEVAKPC